MSERANTADILLASITGSAVAVTLGAVGATVVELYSGDFPLALMNLPFVWLWGMVVACISAVPLGSFIGLQMAQEEPLTAITSSITGAVTGALIALVAGPAGLLVLSLLGLFSGWSAYHLVLRRSASASNPL